MNTVGKNTRKPKSHTRLRLRRERLKSWNGVTKSLFRTGRTTRRFYKVFFNFFFFFWNSKDWKFPRLTVATTLTRVFESIARIHVRVLRSTKPELNNTPILKFYNKGFLIIEIYHITSSLHYFNNLFSAVACAKLGTI